MKRAALYLRLSREDEEHVGESGSILNQREFLQNYCREKGYQAAATFVDDGWSGLNFERPGFLQMLTEIDRGNFDLVLVKDLSRLGRDYILTGYYLERYFPQRGVRLIAVADGIDTGEGSDDMTPFRAVFNDLYAKDISKKVRASLEIKRRMGEYIGAAPPYGYRKDPQERHRLIPDGDKSRIVQEIFSRFLQGETIKAIAQSLTDRRELPPGAGRGREDASGYGWTPGTVRRILQNPVYRGTLVQGRTQVLSYKLKKRVRCPEDSWAVFEGQHPPLVSAEEFALAGEKLSRRQYRGQDGESLFTGLCRCPECGAPMRATQSGGRRYLVCARWKDGGGCTSHCQSEDGLRRAAEGILWMFWGLYGEKDAAQGPGEKPDEKGPPASVAQKLTRESLWTVESIFAGRGRAIFRMRFPNPFLQVEGREGDSTAGTE